MKQKEIRYKVIDPITQNLCYSSPRSDNLTYQEALKCQEAYNRAMADDLAAEIEEME